MEKYHLPQGDDWSTSHVRNLELILKEARDCFDADHADFKRVRDRMMAYIRLLIPIVSIVAGIFVRESLQSSSDALPSGVWWALALLGGVLFICLLVLALNQLSIQRQPEGYQPRFLVRDYFLFDTSEYKLNDNQRYVMLLRNRIESLQSDISSNYASTIRNEKLLNFVIAVSVIALTLAGMALVFFPEVG